MSGRNSVFSFTLLMLVCLADQSAKAEQDFSGTWKRNCADGFGLLIEPAEGQFYSVIFCGLRACSRTWTADTRIKGDPKYKIVSDGELGIRRLDDSGLFFFYKRCPDDQALRHRPSIP